MLDTYIVQFKLSRQTVEKHFSNPIVSETFKKLLTSKEFMEYQKKLLTKVSQVAEEKGFEYNFKIEKQIKNKIRFLIKMNLYREVIEEAAQTGMLTQEILHSNLCYMMNMAKMKEYLKPLRTKRYIKRVLKVICGNNQ